MSATEISKSCIDFAYTFKLSDAPASTQDHAKKCLLDWLGCAIRGATMPQAACIRKYTGTMGGNFHATIIGDPTLNSIFNTALCNGYFSHILEMDDVDKESITHPGTVVIPAALSIGEWSQIPGADFLAAIIAGYEVMLRVGAAVTPAHYQIWHTTATSGVFGSAVAASRLLKLSREEMTWALGNAGTLSAGLWEFLQDGAMSKYLHAGKAAATGVMTACLANTGFTGASRILEGAQGFFAGYARQEVNPAIFEDFGVRYRTGTVSFKPYPCCRHTHSAIDCAKALHNQLAQSLDTVKDVRISTYKAASSIAGNENPQDSRQAQFSLKYVVSHVLKNGTVGLSSFEDTALFDPDVRTLMEKVHVEIDPSIDSLTPAAWPAKVTVTLLDGREIVEFIKYPKGDPENPLDWNEVKEKFSFLVSGILNQQGIAKVISLCENIESVDDCGQLLQTVNRHGVF